MELSGKSFPRMNFRVRGIFNGLCVMVLFFILYKRGDILRNSFHGQSLLYKSVNGSVHLGMIHRRMVEISDNSSYLVDEYGLDNVTSNENTGFCDGLEEHDGYKNKCEYLKEHPECSTGGLFDYLQFFYCDCHRIGLLGFAVLGVWLSALFYLLGNTAADYFCPSLERLSSILKLPPTVAGVTLLPFGNGANDVFASIAAFVGTDAGQVGLNSVLGGAVFVTFVVAGTVSLLVASKQIQIDKVCFLRDLSFFIVALLSLLWILAVGRVTVGAAVAYLTIYVVYAFVVGVSEMLKKQAEKLKLDSGASMNDAKESILSQASANDSTIYNPLLDVEAENDASCLRPLLPQWMWASNVTIYSNQSPKSENERPPWGWDDEHGETEKSLFSCPKLFAILEIPLSVPRRLTIPMVEEETWSKPYAVASVLMAPILLVLLWSIKDNPGSVSKEVGYSIALLIGSALGVLAYRSTISDRPPERYLLPWVLGGFFMSIVWFYIIASELVALLIGFGVILGINPSILGLTILAWGNSIGDLVSDIALALNGGDGIQIAFSGCYAGPMFNTLIGLGVSLLLGAASSSPASFVIPKDSSLFYTIGFLLVGLIWAIVILLWKDMQPSKVLGVGLLSLYLIFLVFGVARAIVMTD